MSKFEKLMGLSSIGESVGDFDRSTPPPSSLGPRSIAADQVGKERSKDVYAIDVDRIIPDPDQPRKEFDADALARLAESLKTRGQLQPIQVRWDEGAGRYVVLLGERRWRAAQSAGLTKLQCIVRSAPLASDEKLSLQLVENALREDLSPLEQARAFRTLMDRQGWNQERLAEELAVSRALVYRSLSLLKLPASIQDEVEQGALAPSAAYEIAKLDDPAAQVRLATVAAEQGLTRDDVAKQVRKSPLKKRTASAKKLPTARVWRVDGYRVEISRKSGVDSAAILTVLEEITARLRDELAGIGGQEAA